MSRRAGAAATTAGDLGMLLRRPIRRMPTSWCRSARLPAWRLGRSAMPASGCTGHGTSAQSHRRLRADRARRPHPRPAALRHRPQSRSATARSRCARRRRTSRRSARCCISRRTSTPRSRACCWSRRCRAISRRCCAAPCAPCCPSTTSTSPTGTMRATCALTHGRFGFDEYIEHLIQFLEVIGAGRACGRGVPALRRGAGGGRGHGAGRAIRRSRAA